MSCKTEKIFYFVEHDNILVKFEQNDALKLCVGGIWNEDAWHNLFSKKNVSA